MQILMLGQNDPAGMMIAFANAINRYTEHTARVISLRTVYGHNYDYDLEIPRCVKDGEEDFSEVEHLLKTSDIFHFHMLLDEYHQLGPHRIIDYVKGKGLLYHHHGTFDHQMFLDKAPEYTEMYKRTGKRAIVSTPDLLKLLPDVSTWQPNIVPLFEADYLPRYDHLTDQEKIKIVQVPTRMWHKHTAEFKRVTDRIIAGHPNVERHIIQGETHREALRFKRRCHISFDHMNGWFGIASLESLALGHPTLAGLDDWCAGHMKEFAGSDDLPWVVVRNEEELEGSIRQLVENPQARLEIGKSSRAFMENHWTEQKAVELLVETYQGL